VGKRDTLHIIALKMMQPESKKASFLQKEPRPIKKNKNKAKG
jgi:hypothetical protein